MHEIGIMESAVATVLDQARLRDAQQVHRIVLRIGRLAGVEPDALRFAFEVVAAGTLVAGAELEIETVPARARCASCDLEFTAESGFVFICPLCLGICGALAQGREIELARIELT